SPIRSGRPWVKSAAQVTLSGTLRSAEVEEELTVSLRAGQARVGGALHPGSPAGCLRCDAVDNAPVNLGVADDAAPADLLSPRLELRFDENERPPARCCAGERRRQGLRERDEGDIARDEGRPERELPAVQVAHVHPLHDRDARILSELRVELAI